jgi:6,7-dimethyl-8-ribityllumazine synthase
VTRTGIPDHQQLDGSGLRVAIVASRWHDVIMDGLIDGARRACKDSGADGELIRVPGSFELPLGAATALDAGFDACVALGVVIRGDTPHNDYVCRGATDQLARLSVDSRTPIGFGLLTCDTEAQAIARAGLPDSVEDKGYEATAAAIELATTRSSLLGS